MDPICNQLGYPEQLFLKMCDCVANISLWQKKSMGSMSVLDVAALLKELMMQRDRMPFSGHQAG